jgi:hypothetical protein
MQMLFHLSESVAQRLKETIPARSRSAFVEKLIEAALPPTEDWLYQTALRVEADLGLNEEMAEFDGLSADGLDGLP